MERSEDEKQPPEVITSDTENATQVRPDEAPPHKRQQFERFRAYNTGLWNGPRRENTEQIRRQDDLHRYDAMASSIGLTDYQQQRGRKVLDDLDFQTLGLPIDNIIFGVTVVVANEAIEDGYRYWPHPEASANDERFAEFADEIGMNQREQLSVVQKIRSRIEVEQSVNHSPDWDRP